MDASFLILLLLFAKLLPAEKLSLPPLREDGFAIPQTFLTNGTAAITTHDAIRLSDNTILILSTILYPPNHTNPLIRDDPSVTHNTTIQTTAILLTRLTPLGDLIWSRRSIRVPPRAKFALAVHEQFAYVAGEAFQSTGMLLIKFTLTGSLVNHVVHGHPSAVYHSIHATPAQLLLVCSANAADPPFNTSAAPPERSAICIAKVDADSLASVSIAAVSQRNSSVPDSLVRDTFWSAALSHDSATLFIAVRRQTVLNYIHSYTPTIIAVATDFMRVVVTPRVLPAHLQNEMTLCATADTLYASYVSRVDNKEYLLVYQLSYDLQDKWWLGTDSATFTRHIIQDVTYTRLTRSDVRDIAVDTDGNVRILLYSSELIARQAGDNAPESLRKLSNGRPAVVVLTRHRLVSQVDQPVTTEQWVARKLIIGHAAYYIAGENKGVFGGRLQNKPSLLLTAIKRDAIPSPSPSMEVVTPSSGDSNSNSASACIGESSVISGKSIIEIITLDGNLRLQTHPIQRILGIGAIEMLCYSWRKGYMICATRFHIVRWQQRLMYMEQLCGQLGCDVRVDRPVNFKGACGHDVQLHANLSVTMHAACNGNVAAEVVARRECRQLRASRLRWLVTNL